MFRQRFHEVAELIDAHKEAGYEQLAINMQRREASFILKKIGGQLAQKQIWYCTIHDSVVVLAEHQELVKELMLEAFRGEVGVLLTLEAKQLCPRKWSSSEGRNQVNELVMDTDRAVGFLGENELNFGAGHSPVPDADVHYQLATKRTHSPHCTDAVAYSVGQARAA